MILKKVILEGTLGGEDTKKEFYLNGLDQSCDVKLSVANILESNLTSDLEFGAAKMEQKVKIIIEGIIVKPAKREQDGQQKTHGSVPGQPVVPKETEEAPTEG